MLADYLEWRQEQTKGQWLHGRHVLELGCGTGLVGLVAAHQPCQQLVMTDGEAAVVSLAKFNLTQQSQQQLQTEAVSVEHFSWGDVSSTERMIQLFPQKFDIIVAADVW